MVLASTPPAIGESLPAGPDQLQTKPLVKRGQRQRNSAAFAASERRCRQQALFYNLGPTELREKHTIRTTKAGKYSIDQLPSVFAPSVAKFGSISANLAASALWVIGRSPQLRAHRQRQHGQSAAELASIERTASPPNPSRTYRIPPTPSR
jgi:hypothetical protein